MRVVLVEPASHRLVQGERPEPEIGRDDLLLRVKATSVNRADLLQKAGRYPPPPGESDILGLEAAGLVEAVGARVRRWSVGDRVCALLAGGGYGELVRVPSGQVFAIPANLSFEQAAAIPEVFLTAYLNLFLLGRLQPAETLLVHAAAGGVGLAAIQLAKRAGARVVATVRSADKAAACCRWGADLAINSREEDFAGRVKAMTEHRGADLILDPVGAGYFEANLQSLAPDGRLVLIGLLGGYRLAEFDLRRLLSHRWQLLGSTLRPLSVRKKSAIVRSFGRRFLPMFADGRLQPTVDSVYGVREIEAAHRRMAENRNVGKIVVRLNF